MKDKSQKDKETDSVVKNNLSDDLYRQAVDIVLNDNKPSTSYIQRKLRIGYNQASDIIDRMEQEGIVSASDNVGRREVLNKGTTLSAPCIENNKRKVVYEVSNKKTEERKWLIYAFLFAIIAPFLSVFFEKTPAPIEKGALGYIPETEKDIKEQGYQKIVDKLGSDNIKKSNKLLPIAAELVSKSDECDRITNVILSERSDKSNIQILVDCANSIRFIMSESAIQQNVIPKSLKKKMEEQQYKNMSFCEMLIKEHLVRPASYKKSLMNNHIIISNYHTVVQIAFTAKNGLGLPVEQIGYCEFDDRGLLNFDIKN